MFFKFKKFGGKDSKIADYNYISLNPQAFFFKIMRDEISRLTGQKIMIFQ